MVWRSHSAQHLVASGVAQTLGCSMGGAAHSGVASGVRLGLRPVRLVFIAIFVLFLLSGFNLEGNMDVELGTTEELLLRRPSN